MSARGGARLWVLGGVVLAAVLVAATYLLVISPARTQVASVQTQVDDASLQQTVLRHRLRDLETAARRLPGVKAELASADAALPAAVDTQGLLRRVQALSAAAGAAVQSVTIAAGAPSGVEGVVAVPVSLVVDGSADALVQVLAQLQSDRSRLVTVQASSLRQQTGDSYRLSLTVQVYATAPATAGAGPTASPVAPDGAGGGGAAAAPQAS